MPRSTYYRKNKIKKGVKKKERRKHPATLSVAEKQRVLAVMHEDRFVDKAPAEIYAQLLDEDVYLCSVATMYRILRENAEVRERRNVLRHPNYKKPELLATGPNQVWSWDVTKLKGPAKWSHYYLYVMLDIFSRKVVGYLVADAESAELAETLITECCWKESVNTEKLYIHSDRGSTMTSKAVALLYSDLGITKSLSRPHVSNDNPFSEANFKTLKYFPRFPKNFWLIEEARAFCAEFFNWYNNQHYHSGIGLMTPDTVHSGKARACFQARQAVLDKAFALFPKRFTRRPKAQQAPNEVWINKPQKEDPLSVTIATECSGVAAAV